MEEAVRPEKALEYMELRLRGEQDGLLQFSFQMREATKIELANACDLYLRDLRSITRTDANARQLASIIVKPRAIVVHMGALQAVVQKDRVLCFNLSHPLMRSLVTRWIAKINKTAPGNRYFELRAIECLLVELVRFLDHAYAQLSPEVARLLSGLVSTQTAAQLQQLLDCQLRLNEYQEGVLQIRSAIEEVLNSDEDMAEMYLSAVPPRAPNDHDETEMLLEAFMHAVTELDNRVKHEKNRILTTEEYIKIHFDGQRNRLMRMSLVLSLATFSASVSALGASVFGMNLVNHMESDPEMFGIVTSSLAGVSTVTFMGCYMYYLTTKGNRSAIAGAASQRQQSLLARMAAFLRKPSSLWRTEAEAGALEPPPRPREAGGLYDYEKVPRVVAGVDALLNRSMERIERRHAAQQRARRVPPGSVPRL